LAVRLITLSAFSGVETSVVDDEAPTDIQINDTFFINGYVSLADDKGANFLLGTLAVVVRGRLVLSSLLLTILKSVLVVVKVSSLSAVSISVALRVPSKKLASLSLVKTI
jgi:hypothetical protein